MKKFIRHTLIASLAALALTPSFAAPSNNATPAEKAKIEKVVHDYLINQPEVLLQAMQVLQQRQMKEAQNTIDSTKKIASQYAKDLFQHKQDPSKGNPQANIAIVEFYDYQCPHCLDMAPVIEKALKNNSNIRIIFKDFPIRGPLSEVAARAGIAAHKQNKYYELSHALLTLKKPLTEEVIYDTAKAQGINVDQLKKDMQGKDVDAQLQDNIKLAQNLKLFGTPAFFIANTDTKTKPSIEYVPGQINLDQLQSLIDQVK